MKAEREKERGFKRPFGLYGAMRLLLSSARSTRDRSRGPSARAATTPATPPAATPPAATARVKRGDKNLRQTALSATRLGLGGPAALSSISGRSNSRSQSFYPILDSSWCAMWIKFYLETAENGLRYRAEGSGVLRHRAQYPVRWMCA